MFLIAFMGSFTMSIESSIQGYFQIKPLSISPFFLELELEVIMALSVVQSVHLVLMLDQGKHLLQQEEILSSIQQGKAQVMDM